jgi:hypothetical protein
MIRDGREDYLDWGLGHATVAPWLTDDCRKDAAWPQFVHSGVSGQQANREMRQTRGDLEGMDNCLRLSLHHRDWCLSGEQYYYYTRKVLQFDLTGFQLFFDSWHLLKMQIYSRHFYQLTPQPLTFELNLQYNTYSLDLGLDRTQAS